MPGKRRYHTDLWWTIISFIDRHVDAVTRQAQLEIDTIAKACDCTHRTLYRYFADMKKFGILEIHEERTEWRPGREPSTYTLLISPAQMRDRWDEIFTGTVDLEPTIAPRVEPDAASELTHDVVEILDRLEAGDEDAEIDAWLA